MGSYSLEDEVKDVLSGKSERLELDCEDYARDVPIDMFDDEVEANIRCLLEEAGLLAPDMTVHVNRMANYVDCEELGDGIKNCYVSQGFEVYGDDLDNPIAYGHAVTVYYAGGERENMVDVARTTIFMDGGNVRRLYEYVKTRKLAEEV